ncbi:hypothetical protein EMCRGX_G024556 [Ephydatia muelleri]
MQRVGKRARQPSAKVLETTEDGFEKSLQDQNSQKKITKLEALGRADQMPICETDCVDGAELLITEHGQEYPVTFVTASTQTAKTTQNVVKGILKKANDTMKPVVQDQQSQSALRRSRIEKRRDQQCQSSSGQSVGEILLRFCCEFVLAQSFSTLRGVTNKASLPQAKVWVKLSVFLTRHVGVNK